MFVDEKSEQKAAFVKTGSPITLAGNYDKGASTYGLWNAHGVASKSYKYQLLICDTTFYKGLHVSGYTKKCFKKCDNCCGDVTSTSKTTVDIFADDTTLSTSAPFKDVAGLCAHLCESIRDLESWSNNNRFKLNTGKTKAMVVSGSRL